MVNPVKWKAVQNTVGKPAVEINLPANENYTITITWKGNKLSQLFYRKAVI